jgi:hypothetical protein
MESFNILTSEITFAASAVIQSIKITRGYSCYVDIQHEDIQMAALLTLLQTSAAVRHWVIYATDSANAQSQRLQVIKKKRSADKLPHISSNTESICPARFLPVSRQGN